MFEQGGGGRRQCLTFLLWIKDVYPVDNFWPVDKSKAAKLSTGYAQWQENNTRKLSTACPQSYAHRNAANQSVTPAPILAFMIGPRRVLLVHILQIQMVSLYNRRPPLDQ
jgi:hypothetical protein